MEDIKESTSMWIVAKLLRSERPVPEKTIALTLCDQAFEMMSDTDFKDTLDRLARAGYILNVANKSFIDHVPLNRMAGMLTQEFKEVERKYSGYELTTEGVLAFRRQIKIPIQKIMAQVDKLAAMYIPPENQSQFREIIKTLKDSTDVGNDAADLIIKSSPMMKNFIMWAKESLSGFGIDIPF